jgi:predicted lipid-binding transport protein (Tim44 family)
MALEATAMNTTSNRRRWALALALILLTLALHTGDAFARAGSGGSRGSRSYSTPARPPASPSTPSTPSRQYTAPSSQPAPASRGWFGPIMGGLAGFALGGLLGGMLFGGGFGGGFGLMDMLLIGGALYLLYRVMSGRRAQQPAYAGAGGYGGGTSGADVAYPTGAVTAARPASELDSRDSVDSPDSRDSLGVGLAHIRRMDAGFEPGAVADMARRLFPEVQRAVAARDMSPLSGRLTPRMYTTLIAQCDRLRAARQSNRLEQIDVRQAQVSEAWQESGQDYITVYLMGSLVDYVVEDGSGALVEGTRSPQEFTEYWTFARPVGPNSWKLSAIQTG